MSSIQAYMKHQNVRFPQAPYSRASHVQIFAAMITNYGKYNSSSMSSQRRASLAQKYQFMFTRVQQNRNQIAVAIGCSDYEPDV